MAALTATLLARCWPLHGSTYLLKSVDTVTLNDTDKKVGTARTYENNGAHVVEFLTAIGEPEADL